MVHRPSLTHSLLTSPHTPSSPSHSTHIPLSRTIYFLPSPHHPSFPPTDLNTTLIFPPSLPPSIPNSSRDSLRNWNGAAIALLEQYPVEKMDATKASVLVKARRFAQANSRSSGVVSSWVHAQVVGGQALPQVAIVVPGEEDGESVRKLRASLAFVCGVGREGMPRELRIHPPSLPPSSWSSSGTRATPRTLANDSYPPSLLPPLSPLFAPPLPSRQHLHPRRHERLQLWRLSGCSTGLPGQGDEHQHPRFLLPWQVAGEETAVVEIVYVVA